MITTLVADVAAAYFQLRKLDLELETSQQTIVSRRESLERRAVVRAARLAEQFGDVVLDRSG